MEKLRKHLYILPETLVKINTIMFKFHKTYKSIGAVVDKAIELLYEELKDDTPD